MDDALLTITLVLLCLGIVKALVAIASVRRTLQMIDAAEPSGAASDAPQVLIVICALREQAYLAQAVRHFQALRYPEQRRRILLVTTAREIAQASRVAPGPNTIELAADLEREYDDVYHLHFADPQGLKSDQMNYAVERFSDVCPDWAPDQTFFAFYDADSRPALDVLRVFAATSASDPRADVFQQSATYLDNFFEFDQRAALPRFLLKAQAFKQTRFIFAYEIPRIRRVLRYCRGESTSLLAMSTYAPCVAHGLFARCTLLQSLPFPAGYVPEDMFWGFAASGLRHRIVFLPCLDSSQTPETIGAVFGQLARWFLGPLSTLRYVRYLKRHDPQAYRQARVRVWMMSIFGLYDAAVWLATSCVWWLVVAMSVHFGGWVIALTLAWLGLYQVSVYLLMKRFIPRGRLGPIQLTGTLLCGVLLLAIYSLPAWYSLLRSLVHAPLTTKTERGSMLTSEFTEPRSGAGSER